MLNLKIRLHGCTSKFLITDFVQKVARESMDAGNYLYSVDKIFMKSVHHTGSMKGSSLMIADYLFLTEKLPIFIVN